MALHFREATSVYAKTLPFVLLRLGIGVLLGLVTVLYFGIIFWVGTSLIEAGTISGTIAMLGLLAAGALFVGIWKLFARYALYMVKAAHIAVIAHVVDTGEVPENQYAYGKSQVTEHFAEATALFAVDQVVKGVLKQFNNAIVTISQWASFIPNAKQVIQILGKAVALAATYIDEAIVAHMFLDDEANKWRSARDGVVLYGKSWKPVLTSTLLIVLGMYVTAFLLLLVLSPLAAVFGRLSPTIELAGWIGVAAMVAVVYTGFLKPWVKTVVITTFLIESRGQTPDSETMTYIEERSEKFGELMEKAETEPTEAEREEADKRPAAAKT